MNRRTVLRTISAASLLLSCGVGIWLADRVHLFTVQDVLLNSELSKHQRNDVDQILLKFKGQRLWQISNQEIFASIQALPWVEQVEVSKTFPTTLQVSIKPKQVLAILVSRKGQMIPVSFMGELLPATESRELPDVPVLKGEAFLQQPDLRRDVVELINSLPIEGKFSRKTLLELSFEEKHGIVATLAESGSPVWLGTSNLSAKATRVSRVLEYMKGNSLESRVIDATYDKKVLVRLRKDP